MLDADDLLNGRYRLGRVLGGGGVSTTYLAEDTVTGASVVVKALSVGEVVRGAKHGASYSYDPDDFTKLVELFEREARVLAHLEHPGIPRFIDHFREERDGDTWLYTVQEHVSGKTLEALVKGGRHFTEAEAKDVGRQVAEILAYVHGRSPPLIHRDIKPANILLDEDDVVHLVDFGSVRDSLGQGDLGGKTIVGTYGYMPMEQYEGRAVAQSDFYALGMTLIFLLSGRDPTTMPRRGMKLDFRLWLNVSELFAVVLEHLIEPDPDDRPRSAEAVIAALEQGPRTVGPGKRSSARPFAIAAAAALAVGVGWASMLHLGSDPVPASANPLARPASVGSSTTPAPDADALHVDIDKDFRYAAEGFPMGLAVGQTDLPPLADEPAEELVLPASWASGEVRVRYGYFPLGNGADSKLSFALVNMDGTWSLHVDRDNDGDLTDDGPPVLNQGSGKALAAKVAVDVEVTHADGSALVRPYDLWAWFDEPDQDGRIRGRFYALNHYRGVVRVGDRAYDAVAFEKQHHDALYRESGLCIDLDGNGTCQEATELFHDGDVVGFADGARRLVLDYP